jgi:hypothetical protein
MLKHIRSWQSYCILIYSISTNILILKEADADVKGAVKHGLG